MTATASSHDAAETKSPAGHIIDFDAGILGFASHRKWILVRGAHDGTAWLQSDDREAITFFLVDPFVAFDSFTVDLSSKDLRRLATSHATDVVVYALVTLPRGEHTGATANLQAPLVINLRGRRGMQIVVENGPWGVREPLAVDALCARA